jgi:hypothetical protein
MASSERPPCSPPAQEETGEVPQALVCGLRLDLGQQWLRLDRAILVEEQLAQTQPRLVRGRVMGDGLAERRFRGQART